MIMNRTPDSQPEPSYDGFFENPADAEDPSLLGYRQFAVYNEDGYIGKVWGDDVESLQDSFKPGTTLVEIPPEINRTDLNQ
jgi:hypothetical protein